MTKRVLSIDILRGFGIIFVVLLHALAFRIFGQDRSQIQQIWETTPPILIILALPFVIITLWGSVFTFLSGVSVTYSIIQTENRNSEDVPNKIKHHLVRSLIILVLQYVFLALFSNQISGNTSQITHSLITGFFETLSFDIPSFMHYFTAGTLEAIVAGNIVVSLISYLQWKRNKLTNFSHTSRRFIMIGSIIIIFTFIVFEIIGDQAAIISLLQQNEKWGQLLLFIKIFAGRYSLFPTLSYAMFGAVFGHAIASNQSYNEIKKYGFIVGGIFIGVFMISLLLGFNYIEDLAGENLQLNVYVFNLGGQMVVFTALLKIDYSSPKKREIHKKRARIFSLFGNLTLTVYFFEGINSILLYRIFTSIFSINFVSNVWLVFLYEGLIFLIWVIILTLWCQLKFNFTIEYWIGQIENKVRKFFNQRYVQENEPELDVFSEIKNPIIVLK